MSGQKGRRGEPGFRFGIRCDSRLAGIERKADLSGIVAGQPGAADVFGMPAHARLQQKLPVRQPLVNRREFHIERLTYKNERLIEQRIQIVAGQRELSERGDHGLFQRAVEQNFFRLFAFGVPLLQRFRHAVENLRQLAQFIVRGRQSRARGQIAVRDFFGRSRHRLHLPANEKFAAHPRRHQRQNPHHKPAHRQVIIIHEQQRRHDEQQHAADQLHPHGGEFEKWFCHSAIPKFTANIA